MDSTSALRQTSVCRLTQISNLSPIPHSDGGCAGDAAYLDDGEDDVDSEPMDEQYSVDFQRVDGPMDQITRATHETIEGVANPASLVAKRIRRHVHYETRLEAIPDQSNIPKELRFEGASDKTCIPQLQATRQSRSSAKAAKATNSVEAREEQAAAMSAAGILHSCSMAVPSPEPAIRRTQNRSHRIRPAIPPSSTTGFEELASMYSRETNNLRADLYFRDLKDGSNPKVDALEALKLEKNRKAKGTGRLAPLLSKRPRLSQDTIPPTILTHKQAQHGQEEPHNKASTTSLAPPHPSNPTSSSSNTTTTAPVLQQIFESQEAFKQACLAHSASVFPGRMITPYTRRPGSLSMRCINMRTKGCDFAFNLNLLKDGSGKYRVTTTRPYHNDGCMGVLPDTKNRLRENKGPISSVSSHVPKNVRSLDECDRNVNLASSSPEKHDSNGRYHDNLSISEAKDSPPRSKTSPSNPSVSMQHDQQVVRSTPLLSSTGRHEQPAGLEPSEYERQYTLSSGTISHFNNKEGRQTPTSKVQATRRKKRRAVKNKGRLEQNSGKAGEKPKIKGGPYAPMLLRRYDINDGLRAPNTKSIHHAGPALAALSLELSSLMEVYRDRPIIPPCSKVEIQARQQSSRASALANVPDPLDLVAQTASFPGTTPLLAPGASPASGDYDMRFLQSLSTYQNDTTPFSLFGYPTLEQDFGKEQG